MIVKIVLACFVVGYAISVFDIDPARIVTDTWHTVVEVARLAGGVMEWALPYILIGAVIVLPVAAVAALLRWTRGRGRL